MRVGLDVAAEPLEHRADGVARVFGLVLEEDVVFIREHDEEVPLRARLAFAIRDPCRLNRNAGGIGGEAERGLLRLFRAGIDNGAEGRADVLGVAAHDAVVEIEPFARQFACEAVKGHTPAELLREDMRDERRREESSLVGLQRIGCGHEFPRAPSAAGVVLYTTRALTMRTGPPRR